MLTGFDTSIEVNIQWKELRDEWLPEIFCIDPDFSFQSSCQGTGKKF